MRRLAMLCLCLLLATLGSSPVLAAQTSTPAAAPAPATAPLDLATMMLVPADVKRPHAAIWSGARFFVDAYPSKQAAQLKAAGDLGGFEQWLGPPTTDRDYQVAAAIDEFKDAKGAATGYAVSQSSRPRVSGVKTIGDASALYRLTDTDPYDPSRPDYGLTLVFRVGRLVGTLYVDSYTDAKPHAAEAIALGDIMVARITQVLAGTPTKPGLTNRAVRFKAPVDASFQDGYYRLNGKDRVGWEGNLPKGAPTFAQTYRGATNVMLVGQYASTESGAPWERVRLVQFPTNTAAAAWVDGFLAVAEQEPSGWRQVKPVAGAKKYGDQSQTVTFQRQGTTSGKTVYGTAIITRDGALAVSVRIEAYKPVPVALVQGLMAAQEKCLKASGNCPRVTPSKALLQLTVTSAGRSTPPRAAMRAAAVPPVVDVPQTTTFLNLQQTVDLPGTGTATLTLSPLSAGIHDFACLVAEHEPSIRGQLTVLHRPA